MSVIHDWWSKDDVDNLIFVDDVEAGIGYLSSFDWSGSGVGRERAPLLAWLRTDSPVLLLMDGYLYVRCRKGVE